MIKAKNTLEGKLNVSVVKEYPELENVTITPTLEEQKLKSEKYGFEEVIVEAIPATNIEINPSIEEQVKTGIFKTVTVNAIKGQELNLNPSEEQQNYEGVFLGVNINPIQVEEIETDLDFSSGDAIELKAQEGAYIKKATINKDANLTPENIKSGVSIAGISGEVADTSDADATSDDIISGKTAYVGNEKIAGTYIPLDTSDATATAEDIAKDKTAYVNGEKVVGTLEVNDNNKLTASNPIVLSSDTGTVQVKVFNKNLFDLWAWYGALWERASNYVTQSTVDGIFYIKIRPGNQSSYKFMEGQFKENTQYALSFKGRQEKEEFVTTGFVINYTDGTKASINVKPILVEEEYTYISEKDKTIDCITMSWNYGKYCLFRDIQLEEGTEVTEYMEYGDESYTFAIDEKEKIQISLT